MVAFDDCVQDISNEDRKKMNILNAKAFNKVKQKLKKYLSETGDNENFYEV